MSRLGSYTVGVKEEIRRMKDSREKIFGMIRRGLRSTEKYLAKRDNRSPLKNISRDDFATLFAKFNSELTKLGGEALAFADDQDAAEFITSHAGKNGFVNEELSSWYDKAFDPSKHSLRTSSDFAFGYDKREAAVFDTAISPCTACVAETGTVVVANSMRLPAALAARLFVIAEPHKLIPSLDQLFTENNKNFTGSNLFLITGPSRTADIEKELVTGVHGPKEVCVIFVSRNS